MYIRVSTLNTDARRAQPFAHWAQLFLYNLVKNARIKSCLSKFESANRRRCLGRWTSSYLPALMDNGGHKFKTSTQIIFINYTAITDLMVVGICTFFDIFNQVHGDNKYSPVNNTQVNENTISYGSDNQGHKKLYFYLYEYTNIT